MFDWKEFFPVQAVAPFVGGLILWFGFNYVYFAPSVIAPRLAQRYYVPACVASMAKMKDSYLVTFKAMDDEFEKKITALRAELAERMNNAVGSSLNMMFGGTREGAALAQRGQAYFGNSMAGGFAKAGIEREVAKARSEYLAEKQKARAELLSKVRFRSPVQFCACNAAQGLSNRVDTAIYVSSLRVYTPDVISRLEDGDMVGEACGTPPVDA